MEDIVAILAVFGMAPFIVWLRSRHKLEEKRLELQAKNGGVKQLESADTKRLLEENRLLRERVENLETIVCSVDMSLNQKVARLVDDQRAAMSPGNAPTAPVNPALDRTATLAPRGEIPHAPTTQLEPSQVLAGRYRIQRLIGRGGMGSVYLADDEVLGELVALKVISSAFSSDEVGMVARFRREASAARKVSSP